MPIEYERKFHLKGVHPPIFRNRLINKGVEYNQQRIHQTYLVHDRSRGFVERIRSITEDDITKYINTKKIGFGEDCREVETEIGHEQYRELLDYFSIGHTISKNRYIIPMPDGSKWEVDAYAGQHMGLLVAEIELPSPDTTFEFHPVLGNSSDLVDVSDDKTFKNWYLAGVN